MKSEVRDALLGVVTALWYETCEVGGKSHLAPSSEGFIMKWQYRTVAFPIPRGFFPLRAGGQIEDEELTRKLDELGGDGWELVSAFDTNYEGGSTNMVVCILKRPAS